MQLKYFAPVLIFLGLNTTCFGWGAEGHKMVAKIAYTQLKSSVKDSLAKYLQGATIEEASVWMDEVKQDRSYDFQKPWHYINIDKGGTYTPGDTGNIVWELNRVIKELKQRDNLSKEKIATDIKILIHLIGDLHQPLHVGYAGDQGGNTVQVFYIASADNLHRVWDTDIIRDEVVNQDVDWKKVGNFTKEELAQIKRFDIAEWMKESRSLLDTVYQFKGNDIGEKYAKRNAPIIERQILIAGLRLGGILNDVFRAPKAEKD
jgi:hypothetical protein